MAQVEPTTTSNAKARWTRLATLGLLMAAVGPLLMLVAGLIYGLDLSEDGGFFLITGAIGLVGAFFVWRFGTWSKFIGILAALMVGAALFWTAFSLFVPMSFFDFVPAILVVPGILIAIVSCIAAIVAARRGHKSTSPEGGEKRGIRIVVTAVVVLAVLSAVLSFVSMESADESDADSVVVLKDFEFDETDYAFDPGSTVLVRNDDPFLHTFTVEELDIDEAITPGSEVLVEIPDESGSYVLFCRPHSDPEEPDPEEDMAANLTIE